MNEKLANRIRNAGLMATPSSVSPDQAAALAGALTRGGVNMMEITLRRPDALDTVRALRESFPDLILGVGTILDPEGIDAVLGAGADFGMSPGWSAPVIQAAKSVEFPFVPGVITPAEITQVLELGCHQLKWFPFGQAGGLDYLSACAGPFRHLGVEFILLSGVNQSNAGSLLADPGVMAVGGSWLAPDDLIGAESWDSIEGIARESVRWVSSRG